MGPNCCTRDPEKYELMTDPSADDDQHRDCKAPAFDSLDLPTTMASTSTSENAKPSDDKVT